MSCCVLQKHVLQKHLSRGIMMVCLRNLKRVAPFVFPQRGVGTGFKQDRYASIIPILSRRHESRVVRIVLKVHGGVLLKEEAQDPKPARDQCGNTCHILLWWEGKCGRHERRAATAQQVDIGSTLQDLLGQRHVPKRGGPMQQREASSLLFAARVDVPTLPEPLDHFLKLALRGGLGDLLGQQHR